MFISDLFRGAPIVSNILESCSGQEARSFQLGLTANTGSEYSETNVDSDWYSCTMRTL